jgi:SAM-dependent methyltransferase
MELIEANAEEVPLPDGSFDLALSEYGASIWCDPYRWIPEAARLLRPGGELVFLRNSTLCVLCAPDDPDGKVGDRLLRPQFGMHRMEWSGEDEGIDFQLPHGEWIRLLRDSGFEIEGLWELQAPESSVTHGYYDFVSAEWARKWPAEEIWKARKQG